MLILAHGRPSPILLKEEYSQSSMLIDCNNISDSGHSTWAELGKWSSKEVNVPWGNIWISIYIRDQRRNIKQISFLLSQLSKYLYWQVTNERSFPLFIISTLGNSLKFKKVYTCQLCDIKIQANCVNTKSQCWNTSF